MNKMLHINGQPITLEALTQKPGEATFTIEGIAYHFRGRTLADGTQLLEQKIAQDIWQQIFVSSSAAVKGIVQVEIEGVNSAVSEQIIAGASSAESQPLSPRAPMPGLVRKLFVKQGDVVKKGQPMAVMEAMKLQVTLTSGGDAIVEKQWVQEGDMIAEGAELFSLVEKEAS